MENKRVKKSSQKSYQRIKSERISFRLTEKEKEVLWDQIEIFLSKVKQETLHCIQGGILMDEKKRGQNK